ncbi:MAG: hypothetical protein A2788_01315 [Candidatus Abawacabacteria bacterium RIFCSPHIGHO2_01_FULL_46_8]|uniref:Leucine-binding protein domain-containing protein n=1 Tax=Candidatus Abawacabacteria bacterium RIFCSPHIGHO2_01_FULL_46_8 TaxID=1817815 RepID=A0A1F4XP25_9BACT|nr:MAG: hypothetical protein A2788_01315 [Candidatus Abawacabacteria bacterium RIFCSPHIGHO2_01_FULL_46_8]
MKRLGIGSWLVLLFLLTACGQAAKTTDTTPLKIGAILPLTGVMAVYGESQQKSLQLALDQANQAGGVAGRQLELLLQDNRSTPKDAVTAAQALLQQNPFATFSTMTPTSAPLAPIFAQAQRLLLIGGSISPLLAPQSRYIFKDYADVRDWAGSLARVATAKNLQRLSLLVFQTEQGDLFIKHFQANYSTAFANLQRFDITEKDFRSYLIKSKGAKADGVVFVGYPDNNALVLRQMYELNFVVPTLLINGAWPKVTENPIAANALQPITTWYTYDEHNQDLPTVKFRADYQQMYGEEPDQEAAYVYDTVQLLLNAMRGCVSQGQLDKECVTDGMLATKDYPGVAGTVSFDADGNSQRPTKLVQFKDGAWQNYLAQ